MGQGQKLGKQHRIGLLGRDLAAFLLIFIGLGRAPFGFGYTANKVWFEFRPEGIYRVYVNYTVPELKEFRESYVEFVSKKNAQRFYFDLVRGADFYPPDPKERRFLNQPMEPDPW